VDLMSIGEFARLSRLSAKVLRLYDELGLLVSDSARAWAAEQQRQPSDLPLRVTLLTTTTPVTDASKCGGSDYALPLRRRRMTRGAACRDDKNGRRRYVRAASDPDREGYFDAGG
jgi:hypothetical protein